MNREDIIRMARECFADLDGSLVLLTPELEQFAALVAAEKDKQIYAICELALRTGVTTEREACALVVENCCSYCAERIRERDGKPRELVQHSVSVDDITKAALKILDAELTKQGLQP